ncbi:trypsin-like serine peptidase [Staphylococcus sp. mip270_02]
MNKNIVIKSLVALTVITSVGAVDSISNSFQSIAKAERNVSEIKDGNVSPYNSVFAFRSATAFAVGKNTIVTNKHVAKYYKVGDRIAAHPTGYTANGGIYFIKDIVQYPGKEDIVVIHVHGKSNEGFNFSEKVGILPLAEKANINERISIIGYPKPPSNGFKLMQSTGSVKAINDGLVFMDAFAEPGNSGSPILNSNNEVIGMLRGGSKSGNGQSGSENTHGVYFSAEVKNFIQSQVEK